MENNKELKSRIITVVSIIILTVSVVHYALSYRCLIEGREKSIIENIKGGAVNDNFNTGL